ncbi:MAG TPA: HD domain-containing phosphohydrolase [Gemmatimonadaceae bacterium]|nr:HD domain-containing phosphohydrolase [Gemmatimonadaceae bacterium]
MTTLADQDVTALAAAVQRTLSSDVKVLLSRIAMEVNSRLQAASSSSAAYVDGVITTLKSIDSVDNAELRINILLDAAQFFYLVGQTFNAIQPATNAVEIAEKAESKALLRKSLTFAGVLYADTGNTSRAIECYAQALDIARDLRDLEGECAVWVNLGVALLYAAQYRDAISCLEHTVHLSGAKPGLQKFRSAALANIALCCLHLEDFSRGLKAAEKSIEESPEPHTATDLAARVTRENNYTRLLLEVNAIEKARERCELARRFAQRSKSARAEIAASIAEGLFEVHAGRVDVGISRLTNTLEKARLLRPMLRETLAALVKAFELIGEPQRALIYLREMMEALRQTQQENALKHVQLHLDQLGHEVIGEAQLATRLKRQEAVLQGKVAEQELFRSRIEMLERLAVTAELRDDSTGEHSYRVGRLASLLAQEFGCDESTCFMIELAARLHDIGKIGVPDAILLKPDKLNDPERQIMRTHTTVGAELLSKSNIPHMQMAEEIARHHHEWWNGSGYPGNLSGTAIPLAARITALADVFDALTHQRPYKIAWPMDSALDEIAQLKGLQFDPQLCDLFIVLVQRLRKDHIDLDSFLGQAAHQSPFLQARSRIWNALHKSHDRDGEGSGSRLDMQR